MASRPAQWRQQAAEVFYGGAAVVTVDRAAVDALRDVATGSPRGRSRLCTHEDATDRLHEMLIVHRAGVYVRPHRHIGRSESFQVVDGEFDVLLFDEQGAVTERFRMGSYASGARFYCRLNQSPYHSFVFHSDTVAFLEVTSGPFDPSSTEFAPWAPAEEAPGAAAYFEALQRATAGTRLR